MYEPPLHRQDEPAALYELIRRNPLGLLVSHGPQGLLANAIPFLVDSNVGERGLLSAHMARANGQWRDLKEGGEALVVFQGVDHYVSPSWYATKRETGKVVPTWNYVIVQARGVPKVIEDEAWLRGQIDALTHSQESPRPAPWAVSDAPDRRVGDRHHGSSRQVENEPEPQRGRSRGRPRRPTRRRRRPSA